MQMNILEFLKILLKKERIDILLTHYTDPRSYPTELYTINILRKEGFNVKEICIEVKSSYGDIDKSVFIFTGKRKGKFHYLYTYPIFCITIFLYTLLKRPKLIFAYETFAFMPSFITAKIFNIPIIYHIHDIFQKKGLGIFGLILKSFENKFIKFSNIISMPNKNRIEYYENISKLPEKKYVIFNAISIKEDLFKKNKLKNITGKKNNIKKWIVKTGGLGDDQCIKELILSLKYLPDEIGIILAGRIKDDFKQEIEVLLRKKEYSGRVIFFNYVPREEILGFLRKGFIGVSLYKPENINNEFPAPMKLAEFIAAGIPAVVNDSEYFRELNKKVGSFVFADPYSPESIAKAILKVYKDKKLEKKLRENSKKAYKTFYNFEYQFEPVLKEIKKWVKK